MINTVKSVSAALILKRALEKGLRVEVISSRLNLIKISQDNSSFFVKSTAFHVNPYPSCLIANNKYLTKKILKKNGLSTPKSFLVKTPNDAFVKVKETNMFPCVLKPSEGAHGINVYANIETIDEFNVISAAVFSKANGHDILLEEYIDGNDFRVLVIGDTVSAVMERIPANVIGDGENTIRMLIFKFNQQPMVGKKYEKPLCKIRINGEIKRVLGKQNRKLSYIPKTGEVVQLRENANISTGGIGKDATDTVSEELKELAIHAARAIGMNITGVDIIQDRMTKKLYVLELNDCPGIDIHHFPSLGMSRDVAGDVIDYLVEFHSTKTLGIPAEITV